MPITREILPLKAEKLAKEQNLIAEQFEASLGLKLNFF